MERARRGRETPRRTGRVTRPDAAAPAPREDANALFYARVVAVTALLVLGYLGYRVLLPLLTPIAWALFLAFLVHPLHAWLAPRLGGRASVSAALLTAAMLVILVGPLTALGAAFAAQLAELIRYAQQLAVEHRPPLLADLPILGAAVDWLQESAGISMAQIQDAAVQAARTVLGSLASLGRQAVLGALGTVIGFTLMMFILFFAIRDGASMFSALRALVPMPRDERARLFAHLASVTRAMVYGTGVTALVQGALIAIGFSFVGLPSPIVFGVLAALFAIVPLMGTPVVWVPAAIYLAAQGRWTAALFLAVWGGFVTTIDNVLRPMLVAGRAQVGTLTVFVGVLGGVSAFGPIGVILGPLVLALAIALVRFALEESGEL